MIHERDAAILSNNAVIGKTKVITATDPADEWDLRASKFSEVGPLLLLISSRDEAAYISHQGETGVELESPDEENHYIPAGSSIQVIVTGDSDSFVSVKRAGGGDAELAATVVGRVRE